MIKILLMINIKKKFLKITYNNKQQNIINLII